MYSRCVSVFDMGEISAAVADIGREEGHGTFKGLQNLLRWGKGNCYNHTLSMYWPMQFSEILSITVLPVPDL